MYIILYAVYIGAIAFTIIVGIVAVFAVLQGIAAWRRGAYAFAVMLFAIASSPVAYYFVEHARADWREDARAREVAGLARVPLPAEYPSTLEVHGYLSDRELLIYLDTLAIDRVYQFQSRPIRGQLTAEIITLKSECRHLGAAELQALQSKSRSNSRHRRFGDCLNLQREEVDADRSHIPAIVFLIDGRTTLRMKQSSNWSAGNYEARLRTADRDVLLDYWERPYIERPAFPWLLTPYGFLHKSNTDWRKYRMNRTEFFTSAMGLAPRKQSNPDARHN